METKWKVHENVLEKYAKKGEINMKNMHRPKTEKNSEQ